MRFCIVDLPLDPPRAGTLRRIPSQVCDTLTVVRESVPGYLVRLGAESAPIEQWDMIGRGNDVLVRSGTIYADRRLVWRKP